jgi:malonyl-CoA O-methyltransferase
VSDLNDSYCIDKRDVRRSFENAAKAYDQAAVLQREVADRLVERLEVVRLQPGRILDAGAGTGYGSIELARRYPKARVIALDLSLGMASHSRARFSFWQRRLKGHGFVCADVERLPLADASIDLVYSNLALQWCNLEAVFAECRRVLRPGGLLVFTTFGPDTLAELRASWAAADGNVHVNAFLDMHDVGDALVRARFAAPVMDVERLTVTYEKAVDLLKDLKTIGAHNVNAGRPRGLTGQARLRAMVSAYEHYRHDGRLPATYEVIYGHAWAPEHLPVASGAFGEARISVEQLKAGFERG